MFGMMTKPKAKAAMIDEFLQEDEVCSWMHGAGMTVDGHVQDSMVKGQAATPLPHTDYEEVPLRPASPKMAVTESPPGQQESAQPLDLDAVNEPSRPPPQRTSPPQKVTS